MQNNKIFDVINSFLKLYGGNLANNANQNASSTSSEAPPSFFNQPQSSSANGGSQQANSALGNGLDSFLKAFSSPTANTQNQSQPTPAKTTPANTQPPLQERMLCSIKNHDEFIKRVKERM